uniref:Uncharacterized protein n=1 Tax=Physcomitrium patens TaxID=3218 RepID=A0A7I4AM73_PHYPA
MKLFGWGRKKDPPTSQLSIQNVQKSDAAWSTRSPGTAYLLQSEEEIRLQIQQIQMPDMGLPRPSKDLTNYQVAIFGKVDECMSEVASDLGCEWEDGLGETIQFVISHQEQGLLTIGTFGLNQLAGVRDNIDRRPHKSDLNNSRRGCVSSVQLLVCEVRSSDDKTELHQSNLRSLRSDSTTNAVINRKELPVFGDHDASSRVFLDGQAVRAGLNRVSYSSSAIPIILMRTPNAVEIEIEKVAEKQPGVSFLTIDCFSDKELCSPGVYGLFTSRRRTPKPDKEWVWNKPHKKQLANGDRELQRTITTSYSPRGVWRLWRSRSNPSFAAKIVTDKKCNSPTATEEFQTQIATKLEGPPCTGNVDDGAESTRVTPKATQQQQPPRNPPNHAKDRCGERIRRRDHSFGNAWACTQNGKWIRTDSECKQQLLLRNSS